jgi:methionine aminotransferase
VHQFVTFATNTPIQLAYATFTAQRERYDDLAAFYQGKRDRFLALLEGSRFTPVPCHGTYFQILDYSAISHDADAAFAMQLLKAHGVASIPTSAFLYNSDAPRVLRFCFAKKDETLELAAARLCAV